MAVYPPRIAPIGLKLRQNEFVFRVCSQTLNGRLPPEDSSDWPETLGKRVSDDLEHFIFRRRKKKLAFFFSKIFAGRFLFSRNWGFGGARRV